jgi:hypothetical protein
MKGHFLFSSCIRLPPLHTFCIFFCYLPAIPIKLNRNISRILFFLTVALFILIAHPVKGQSYKVRGYVYDSSRIFPLEAVTVLSTSGKGTLTNTEGFYEIEVSEKDSIWFSYLGKPTVKFPVLKIYNPLGFDISLHVNVQELQEVKVRQRNYRLDSLLNRQEYAKIFNYQTPRLKTVTPQYGAAMGFDLQEIINAFRFRRNRSMLAFQNRLLQEEREKFINHRYNKALVSRLTGLEGEERDQFMQYCRPGYEFTLASSDYDFQLWIKECFEKYKAGLNKKKF